MQKEEKLLTEIQDILNKTLGIAKDKVVPQAKLIDLVEDSIQLFELLLAFEKAYALETVYDDVVRIQTVQDVVKYLEKHTNG